MAEHETIWLTQDAFDKLNAELEDLKENGRPGIAAKIAAAREEGDLSENGGYHAAREEQGQMEGRIRQLEQMLRNAEVGEIAEDSDQVSTGTLVTIAYFDDADDTETFLLGSREMLGLDNDIETSVFSPQSPLGAAVLGAKKGESVTYTAPNGKDIKVTILEVDPFRG
ncbi:transcription elongation factor GreA [Propionibacterium sp. oral taxon 192 str. F0372]|uniref:transcription elongation factor GreA n=1 Tax=Propionibacterium sp. oral taxon 192 TaxID=671222 RepID=UPI00035285C4|nr:transcription elongation factor GreA [Propionibacterium sp. oral taxon 192]EPH02292.1 transcription elongation factor GreA [Propionibacterium sp. oral taxon 192 str. F0372]